MSGEGPARGINDSTGLAERKLVLTLVKQIKNFYVKKTEIYKCKAKDNINWYHFCLGIVSQDFTKDERSEISLNGTVNDYLVDQSSIYREYILNIYQYLLIKNNIKRSLDLLCYWAF